jgi:6-phosphogluconolactonase (cycloisomerase 2 family)
VGDLVYIGSYGSGISIYERDGERLRPFDRVDSPDPSFLVADPGRRYVYACNELTDVPSPAAERNEASRSSDGGHTGTVSAFAVQPDGRLRLLNTQSTGGTLPCHILLHPAGYLLTANYGSGSVSVHPVEPDGTLGELTDLAEHHGHGPDQDRQAGPHVHEINLASGVVVAVDLGLDRLVGYRLDPSTGRLDPGADPFARSAAGAGPRHAVAHPTGRWYVANELDSTVSVFEPDFELRELHLRSTVPATLESPAERNYPAGIALSGDGRLLYVSNRGANAITTFTVDDAGLLRAVDEVPAEGVWPRHFAIVDGLMLVANERSDSLTGFRLDPDTGRPRPLGVLAEIGIPTCVLPVAGVAE